MISLDQLKTLVPHCLDTEQWYNTFIEVLPEFEIESNLRVSAFLAEVIHESDNFTALSERLNYRAEVLMKVWPKRFPTLEEARKYEHNSQALANKVYANRMGNGDLESGDGYKFRGRGLVQLTGKENHQNFANFIGMDLEDVPAYLESYDGAVKSACFFWKNHGLNEIADTKDINKISTIINGGTQGLDARRELYQKLLICLGETP